MKMCIVNDHNHMTKEGKNGEQIQEKLSGLKTTMLENKVNKSMFNNRA